MFKKPDKLFEETPGRTLYFGGSFNPIHHGHLICARAVAEAIGFSRISLIPTGQPPHKQDFSDIAPAMNRLEMCRLAVAGSHLFEVDAAEVERAGPSYTIDTIRTLSDRQNAKIDWLIGADMLLYLPKWHRSLELLNEVNFVVMARPGWVLDWDALPEPFRILWQNVVQAPMIDMTATQIRRRVALGASIEYFTPESVCQYIRANRLYQQIPIS